MNPVLEAIFGNRTAASVLLFLQCYGEGHALRIAMTFGFGLNMTQRQLKRLEEEGVLVSRLVGNIRLFSFNDRNPTVRNLKELLEAELKLSPSEQVQQYFRQRQLHDHFGTAGGRLVWVIPHERGVRLFMAFCVALAPAESARV